MHVFVWIAIGLITVLSSARLTRLATYDHFPPAKWAREKFASWTDGSDWQLLAYCGYCASFWLTLLVVLLGYFTHWCPIWWLVNGTLGASYLAAVFMTHDGDTSHDAPAPVQPHTHSTEDII